MVRIYLYSVRIEENTYQNKLRIWTPFMQCYIARLVKFYNNQNMKCPEIENYFPNQKKVGTMPVFLNARLYQRKGLTYICLSKPYHFNFCKGCLPQILLGSFLNILTLIIIMCHFYGNVE